MKKYIYFIALSIVFLSSCGDKLSEPCPSNFIVYGEIKPYAETYKIGDTMSLESVFNTMVYEQRTDRLYDLTGINLESVFYIIKIDTNMKNIQGGVLEFVDTIINDIYKPYIQNFNSGGSSLFSTVILRNNTFNNDIKIVFKKAGLFMLTFGPSTIKNNMDFDGKCKTIDFDLNTRLNYDKDNNINLLKQSPDEYFNTWILANPEERFYHGRFAYRVIE